MDGISFASLLGIDIGPVLRNTIHIDKPYERIYYSKTLCTVILLWSGCLLRFNQSYKTFAYIKISRSGMVTPSNNAGL